MGGRGEDETARGAVSFVRTGAPPVIAIVTAVPLEARAIARRLRGGRRVPSPVGGAWEGRLGGAAVRLLCAGMGPHRADIAVRALLADLREPPAMLLSAGLAAGLDPHLAIGDVIGAIEIVGPDERIRCAPHPPVPGVGAATLTATNRVLVTPQEKAALRAASGAAAADMESLTLARAAQAAGIPFLAIRAISDAASDRLPLDFEACRDRAGDLDMRRLLLRLLQRPTALPALLRFAGGCRHAANRLAQAIERMLARGAVPPPP